MATDLNFDKIIDELKAIHNKYPDLRFGQVIQIAMDIHKGKSNQDFANHTSKVILKSLTNFNHDTKSRRDKNVIKAKHQRDIHDN